MSEKSFARVGHVVNGAFTPDTLRARDVEASNGVSAEAHILNGGIHLTAAQITTIAGAIQASEKGVSVATLVNGTIPASQLNLATYQTRANVATYAEMLDLSTTTCKVNSYIFVADASGDSSVESGWAAYNRVATNGNAADFVKVAEGESLDISFPDLEAAIDEAKSSATNADNKAASAQTEAEKLDFAYCTSEADLATKNLRNGAMVLMAVDNN